MTENEKVYALRQRLGMSQDAFGKKLGVSKQTVSRWEKPNGSIPYYAQKRICEVFRVPKEDVFNDDVIGYLTENRELINRIKDDYAKLTTTEAREEVLRLILGGE